MRNILLIVSLLVLGGRLSDASAGTIAVGDTREDVIAALGQPQGALRDTSGEMLNYKDCDVQLVGGHVVRVKNTSGSVGNTDARSRTSSSAPMSHPATPPPPSSTVDPAKSKSGNTLPSITSGLKFPLLVQRISSRVTQHEGQSLTTIRRSVLYAGVGLMVIGIMVAFGAGIWLLVKAFQVHIGWGFACLLLPFASLVFLFRYWEEGRKPFLASIGGALGSGLGMFMAVMMVSRPAIGATTGTEPLPPGVLQAGSLANEILIRDAMTGVAARVALLGCNQPEDVKHIYVVNLPEGEIGWQHWRERWIVTGCGHEYSMDVIFRQDGHHSASYNVL